MTRDILAKFRSAFGSCAVMDGYERITINDLIDFIEGVMNEQEQQASRSQLRERDSDQIASNISEREEKA